MTDAAATISLRRHLAPIAAISVFGMAIAMIHPLLALWLERMGVSGTAIGFNTTASALSIAGSALVLPRILSIVGIGPLMVGSCLALAALTIAFPLVPDYWWWTLFRVIYGFAATAIFFASEYWIVSNAPAKLRGRVISVYTMSLAFTFMLGPVLLGVMGVDGLLPFAVCGAIILIGLVPIAAGLKHAPRHKAEAPPEPRSILKFFVTDPGILWGVLLFGIIEFGTIILLPVWAVKTGYTEDNAAFLMAAFAAGALVFQPFTGWAADRFPSRNLLAVAAVGSTLAPVAVVFSGAAMVPAIAAAMIYGAVAVVLYVVALTELGARYTGTKLSEGNAAIVFAYGLGAFLGPGPLGIAMDVVPPDGLLLGSAAVAGAYAVLVLARIGRNRRPDLSSG